MSPAPDGLARRWRVLLATGAIALTAASLALPAAAFLDSRAGDDVVIDREGAPDVELDDRTEALAARLRRADTGGAPLILSYHDVRELEDGEEPDDIYTVTPEQFALHMAALDEAGYRTVSSDDMARWLDGGDLPPRSVYLTFDDGASGLWRHADAVLERYGMTGAVFVITGRVGSHRPYYLNWRELRLLHDTGRWDLESHTRLGHDRVDVDGAGTRLPFLINTRWLGDRSETVPEALARVESDLDGSMTDFVAAALPPPRFFAYPFSAETKPTNDPALPPLVQDAISKRFKASMSNDEPDRYVSDRDRTRRALSRIEVFRFTTADGLLRRLQRATPIEAEGLDLLRDEQAWFDTSGRRLYEAPDRGPTTGAMATSPLVGRLAFAAGGMTVVPGEGRSVVAAHAPGRTEDWDRYVLTADVAQLGPATAAVVALAGSATPVQLSVSSGFVRVRKAGVTVAEHNIAAADAHRLELRVAVPEVVALVDGVEMARIPVAADASGGVQIAASNLGGTPGVLFRQLTVDDQPAPPLAPLAPAPPVVVEPPVDPPVEAIPAPEPAPRRAPAVRTTRTTVRRAPARATPTTTAPKAAPGSPPATKAPPPPDDDPSPPPSSAPTPPPTSEPEPKPEPKPKPTSTTVPDDDDGEEPDEDRDPKKDRDRRGSDVGSG